MEDIIGTDREFQDFKHFDLLKLAVDYKDHYVFPDRSLTHNTILMIVASRLNNTKSEEIKKKLYSSIGKEGKIELTRENFKFKDKTLLSYGLSHEQIKLIREVLEMKEITIKNLTKIKGIGIWTIKALKVITNEDNICFEQDYNVRNNLGLLYGYDKLVSESEVKKILSSWNGNRTIISYFLWRLKKEAIVKILEEEKLEYTDFLGF